MFSTFDRTPDRYALSHRAGLGLLAAALLVPSLVARSLAPDPRGFGTHEQLGLGACAFLKWTGRHCPTCGMTTSFSHAVRGDWSRAFAASVSGTLLAATSWLAAIWAASAAVRGRSIVHFDPLAIGLAAAAVIALAALSEWMVRLIRG